jgi:hypothetical protein
VAAKFAEIAAMSDTLIWYNTIFGVNLVRRCGLTLSDPVLKAPIALALETII